MRLDRRTRTLLWFALAYAASGEALRLLPQPGDMATLWPAAGVSLVGVVLLGPRIWPLILALDLAGSIVHGMSWSSSLASAALNTSEPLISAALLTRVVRFDYRMHRTRDAVLLAACGGLAGPSIAALVWTGYRLLANQLSLAAPVSLTWVLKTWQDGAAVDGVSVIVVAPLILHWIHGREAVPRRRWPELLAATLGIAATTGLAFAQPDPSAIPSVAYLVFPFVIWLAIRFPPIVVSTTVAGIALMAVTLLTPDNLPPLSQHLIFRWMWAHVFLGALGVTGSILSSAMAEQRRIAAELRSSEERTRDLFEHANDLLLIVAPDGRILDANKLVEQATGLPRTELVQKRVCDLLPPEEGRRVGDLFADASQATRSVFRVEAIGVGGDRLALEVSARRLLGDSGTTAIHAIARDVTERQRLEQQLHQAQKMEAIGRLSGGIAHDFNNLLTIIGGHSELLADVRSLGPEALSSVEAIRAATDRAGSLTRQLLAFSRLQVLHPTTIAANTLITETARLLGRIIGEDIELVLSLDADAGTVRIDEGQFTQVLMNLALNARDAMPDGGRLTIETRRLDIGETADPRRAGPAPGPYLAISVTDTGSGMDESTRARVFEPFFTTKPSGQGTGLGLATVYGIVTQSGGFIEVESEHGRGATFRILLPRAGAPVESKPAPTRARVQGHETILLVEDERALRALAAGCLESHGYRVLEAANADEALRVASGHAAPIDLLLTDVVMPGGNGVALSQTLHTDRPAMRTLFVSGYPGAMAGPILGERDSFLPKPFSMDQLAERVRLVLDAPPGHAHRSDQQARSASPPAAPQSDRS